MTDKVVPERVYVRNGTEFCNWLETMQERPACAEYIRADLVRELGGKGYTAEDIVNIASSVIETSWVSKDTGDICVNPDFWLRLQKAVAAMGHDVSESCAERVEEYEAIIKPGVYVRVSGLSVREYRNLVSSMMLMCRECEPECGAPHYKITREFADCAIGIDVAGGIQAWSLEDVAPFEVLGCQAYEENAGTIVACRFMRGGLGE